ncbi:anti-adapter protein IraM [Escherichia coli]|uniref:anti-adapter protein IraM n=1 Tax=Escherichia coli TaxID=562 RepID=UPI0003EE717A|nr:anti-adapter protein IraM [Escherichia coli]EEV6101151.1 anti-adapter protein IraM [Escherichia coli]EFE7873239.1 anti-adapter protein IraM [Escherichia coli]EHD5574135.1 anti-adapter protein IraM [Escherichia coli]EIH3353946.1 anti-adapter protein IraM [Escherichia coli]EKM7290190.1 anti-adapter protein IraM [Escherichia coli]
MKWIVIDTVIQPTCGISFSAIWGDMKMIIWYQSTIFLPPGGIFTPVKSGIILKDKEYPITIYNIAPFNKDLWSLLKSSQECPPGESEITNKCLHKSCIIKICPYRLK